MKTLTLANQKGGVGKSAVAVQFAFFLHELLKKRVLVIDLDHQRNTSKAIKESGLAIISPITSNDILEGAKLGIEGDFVLVPGSTELIKKEKQASEHNRFATNLLAFLKAVNYDVCIIDTNPNPDIRQLAALVVSDYVLSPIQLNQEAIDGIGDLLNHDSMGVRKIQATINKKLNLLGIIPNLVEPTPFQRENFSALAASFSALLIPMDKGGFAAIKKTTAIPEAQAAGLPVWKIGKTSAREAWAQQIKPVFEKIAELMEVTQC